MVRGKVRVNICRLAQGESPTLGACAGPLPICNGGGGVMVGKILKCKAAKG